MTRKSLKAEIRKTTGRKVKTLRKEGILPANVYGKGVKSLSVKVSSKDFEKIYKEEGETNIIDLDISKDKKRPVIIHNIQVDPVDDTYIHADFLQVDLKQKVTVEIPIELVGESPAEKTGLGTVVQYIDEVQVEALPTDLPDKFEIDISKLENVDDEIKVSDLKIDKDKVKIEEEMGRIIVKVEPLREEEEEPAPVAETPKGEEVEEGETKEEGGEKTPESEKEASEKEVEK